VDHDHPAEAVPVLQNAVKIAPKSAPCHEKLGRALEGSGHAVGGAKELEIAVQLDPTNSAMHFELGRAYRKRVNRKKLAQSLLRAKRLNKEKERK